MLTPSTFAQSSQRYIQFGPGAVKAVLYFPDEMPAPHIGVLFTHRTSNYLGRSECTELAARGYLVLCMNPRSDNNAARTIWELNAVDVGAGVKFLRQQEGIESVLLFGRSGGGGTTSFYQAVAENGLSYCRGPDKIVQCDDRLAGLPPADGLILVDTSEGLAATAIRRLNGAVINDAAVMANNELPEIDPALDPFSPGNGYDPDGVVTYSEEFKSRYFVAQSRRMNGLINLALSRLELIENEAIPYPDDDFFVIPMAEDADLMLMDSSGLPSTQQRQKLLRNDGTIAHQVVDSMRIPETENHLKNSTFNDGSLLLTLRSFLSTYAIRSNDSMKDVDHCSTNNSTTCAIQNISAPLVLFGMQAGNPPRINEMHFELAKSDDKDLVYIEGAMHRMHPCVPCEAFPGQFSNTSDNFYDYLTDWIGDRF